MHNLPYLSVLPSAASPSEAHLERLIAGISAGLLLTGVEAEEGVLLVMKTEPLALVDLRFLGRPTALLSSPAAPLSKVLDSALPLASLHTPRCVIRAMDSRHVALSMRSAARQRTIHRLLQQNPLFSKDLLLLCFGGPLTLPEDSQGCLLHTPPLAKHLSQSRKH